MKVKALTSFSLGGGVDVHSGQVFDLLPEANARLKVSKGWVEPVNAADRAEHPEAGRTGTMTTQDAPPVHRDPPPARRKTGKKGQG